MVVERPTSKTNWRMPRTDATEKILRRRGFEVAVEFERVQLFDVYNEGYIQALKDMEIDKEYLTLYKRVMDRVRKSYTSVRAFYKEVVRNGL